MYMSEADGERIPMFGGDVSRGRDRRAVSLLSRRGVLVVAATDSRRRNSRCIIGRQPCMAGLIANG
jgi:hypothetical protein